MYCGSPLGLFSPGSSFKNSSVVMMVPEITLEEGLRRLLAAGSRSEIVGA